MWQTVSHIGVKACGSEYRATGHLKVILAKNLFLSRYSLTLSCVHTFQLITVDSDTWLVVCTVPVHAITGCGKSTMDYNSYCSLRGCLALGVSVARRCPLVCGVRVFSWASLAFGGGRIGGLCR